MGKVAVRTVLTTAHRDKLKIRAESSSQITFSSYFQAALKLIDKANERPTDALFKNLKKDLAFHLNLTEEEWRVHASQLVSNWMQKYEAFIVLEIVVKEASSGRFKGFDKEQIFNSVKARSKVAIDNPDSVIAYYHLFYLLANYLDYREDVQKRMGIQSINDIVIAGESYGFHSIDDLISRTNYRNFRAVNVLSKKIQIFMLLIEMHTLINNPHSPLTDSASILFLQAALNELLSANTTKNLISGVEDLLTYLPPLERNGREQVIYSIFYRRIFESPHREVLAQDRLSV